MIEVVVDALAFSNLLALLALGITMTYMTVNVANFAHGDLATIGAFTARTFSELLGVNAYLGLPLAFTVSALVALLSYKLVFRPLYDRGVGPVGMMIASIALEVILRSALHIYADIMRAQARLEFRGFIFDDFHVALGGVIVPGVLLVSTALLCTLVASLYLLLKRTRFGVAMRAAVENPSLAEVLGVNVDLVYSVSWALAGGLAGIAGALLPYRTTCNPELGWSLLLRMFAASILGGLSNIYGAILGGYVVGIAEVLGIYLLSKPPIGLSTAYRPAIPFAILIATLLLMPRGLAPALQKLKERGRRTP